MDCLARYCSKRKCPGCGSESLILKDRKYIVARLFECDECGMTFRHPLDSVETNRKFYQDEYVEPDGITTFRPPESELQQLLAGGFKGIPSRDATRIRELIESLLGSVQGVRILDYGASWGYVSYQFRQFGMDVESYEISKPRAEYGSKALDLKISTDEGSLRGGNDIFFSSHVIEHVPNPTAMLNRARDLVRPGGFVITLCPNGSPEFRQSDPRGFHLSWGKVHQTLLGRQYFTKLMGADPYFITASQGGWKRIADWDQSTQKLDEDLSREEILVVWKPTHK